MWLIFFRHHDRKRRDAVIRRAVLDLIGLGIVIQGKQPRLVIDLLQFLSWNLAAPQNLNVRMGSRLRKVDGK